MPVLFVAKSRGLAKWGADVGLTKHIYKLGLAADGAEAAVRSLNETAHAGETDWKLVKAQEIEAADEEALIARVAAKEKMVDPALYPKIKGARGVFKVRPTNVENYFLVKSAMEGVLERMEKLTPAQIADYLMAMALK